MAVNSVNITISKGTTFTETFILSDESGQLFDLNAYTNNLGQVNAIAKLKKYPSSPTSYEFNTAAVISKAEIEISMPSTVTETLPSGRCYFDLALTKPNSSIKTLVLQGQVIVEESISL